MAASRDPFLTPEPVTYNVSTPTPPQSALGPSESESKQILGEGGDGTNLYPWEDRYTNPWYRRRKWIVLGSAIVIIILIAVGVGVGVSVSNNNKKNKNSEKSTSPDNVNSPAPAPATPSPVVPEKDPNDPSVFAKDPKLHQSFWGFAYTPQGTVPPNCTATLAGVIQDIQILSQLTKRIRLYGAECNASALVLEAIKQTKVDMTVWLGNFPNADDAGAAYVRQRDTIEDAIKTYGTDQIGGITVGNEFMLNYLTENNATDANGAVGDRGAQLLLLNITDTSTRIKAMNLAKHIPIGTSDAGAFFNKAVLQGIEYGMANVHPWFAGTAIDTAATWTFDFFETQNVQPAAALANKPTMYIAETGWPTNSLDAAHMSLGQATASVPNLQIFLDTFVCQANKNNTGYFFFELADEPWKSTFGGVEPFWGLFNSDKTLKNVTIPDCPST